MQTPVNFCQAQDIGESKAFWWKEVKAPYLNADIHTDVASGDGSSN